MSSKEPMESKNGFFPNSAKVYARGTTHKDIRVPFREITLQPTQLTDGKTETNESIRVYDTSGPWG